MARLRNFGGDESMNRRANPLAPALLGALALAASTSAQGEERVSTFEPFVGGDIFVAATIMDHPTDDHMGTGRIFQYDAGLISQGRVIHQGHHPQDRRTQFRARRHAMGLRPGDAGGGGDRHRRRAETGPQVFRPQLEQA